MEASIAEMTDDLPDLTAAAMVMRLPEWATSTPTSLKAQGSTGGGLAGSKRVSSTRATSFSGKGIWGVASVTSSGAGGTVGETPTGSGGTPSV